MPISRVRINLGGRKKTVETVAEELTRTLPDDLLNAISTEVLMRFLTQGGATVELYEHSWTERYPATKYSNAHSYDRTGFQWRCGGCDTGGPHSYDSRAGYHESTPSESRQAANAHAAGCRAMPMPGGAVHHA